MKVEETMLESGKSWARPERLVARSRAKGTVSAVRRAHQAVVLGLLAGNRAGGVGQARWATPTQVYRVADRFVEEGLAGLVEYRTDNRNTHADEASEPNRRPEVSPRGETADCPLNRLMGQGWQSQLPRIQQTSSSALSPVNASDEGSGNEERST